MKNGWQSKQLGEICRFIDYRGKTPEKTASGLRLITAKNVKMGYLQETPMEFVSPESYDGWMTRGIPKKGDVLFTTEAPLANVAQLDTDAKVIFAQRIIVLQPSANNLDRTFLKYLLLSDVAQNRILGQGTGATVQGIKASLLKTIPIEFPALPEQKRIVGILDEAFDGIATAKANAQKNLQNARALFESHLQSAFIQRGPGWVVKKTSEIAEHSLGKMLDKAKNKGELRPYLRNINVRWFKFDLSDLLQMPFLPGETEKYTAIKGDVLICEGGYPGRAAIWDEDYPVYFQKALHRVRFHEPEHNKWFVYYLYAQDKSGELRQHFSGTGIQHFTGEVLARFELPLPPLSVLRQAVLKFEELSIETQHLDSLYRQKLAALEALKKSLLHQAFSGEL
ncbi:MAG: type restriction-modification system, specificity subunit [Acidobacteria bacterium]|nr:type restriction-modification system, specificity subunit [Acidobacteriota bacterium]